MNAIAFGFIPRGRLQFQNPCVSFLYIILLVYLYSGREELSFFLTLCGFGRVGDTVDRDGILFYVVCLTGA